jgi:DNA polymerase-3 subunit gamma/tau
VLYRKYRPQNFAELTGQDNIVQVLKQSILDNRIAHAYLFTGPRGTGKTSTARIMAKAINCLNPQDTEPCNVCANCTSITLGKFMDLIEIDAASNRGIEEIRDLKEKVSFLPVEGKYKVYIIDEVHMLTGEAFNALLKTLEEPPHNVIFILATTEVHKLPATILSRTQRFDFKLATEEDLIKKLLKIIKSEGFDSDEAAVSLVARGGMGSFRDSETLLDKIVSSIGAGEKLSVAKVEALLGYADSKLVGDFISALESNDRKKALAIFSGLIAQGLNLQQFVKQVLEELRLKVLASVERGNNLQIRKLLIIIKEINQAATDLKFSLLPKLNVEMAIFNVTSVEETQVGIKSEPAKADTKPEAKVITVTKPVTKTVVPNPTPVAVADPVEDQAPIAVKDMYLKWSEVIDQSKTLNHHLIAMLNGAVLRQGEDGMIQIVVPYAFHKNRLNDAETKKIIQGVFVKVYGRTIAYQCIVDKDVQNSNAKSSLQGNSDMVEDLLQ